METHHFVVAITTNRSESETCNRLREVVRAVVLKMSIGERCSVLPCDIQNVTCKPIDNKGSVRTVVKVESDDGG